MPAKKPLVEKELMDIICCPVCKADLKLVDYRGKKGKKIDGELICQGKCKDKYPIEDGIPILLPKTLRK